MKKLLRNGLRALGLELRRIQDPSAYWSYQFTPAEQASYDQLIAEVAKLDVSESHWFDPAQVRRYLTPRRIGMLKMFLQACRQQGVVFTGKEIADVGCGTGYLFRLMSLDEKPQSMTGYDTSVESHKFAKVVCPAATFAQDDVLKALPDQKFDMVLCNEVMEHLVRPDLAVQQLLKMLRPGGALALTTPNGRFDQVPCRKKLDHAEAYWGHVNFWSPESWQVFIETSSGQTDTHTELLPSGHNFALIKTPA